MSEDQQSPQNPPPVQQDFSQPPAAYPRGPQQQPQSATNQLIPISNPKALMAYYLSIFGLIPGFCLFLGPAGLILGIMGLNAYKANPQIGGKVHAWVGIVLGSLICLACIVATVAAVIMANTR